MKQAALQAVKTEQLAIYQTISQNKQVFNFQTINNIF